MVADILYLSPYFWPEEIGSAPYCTEMAEWLAKQGYQLKVLTFRPHYPSASKFKEWADGSRDNETYATMKLSRVPVRDRSGGGFKDRLRNDLMFLWTSCRRALRSDFKGSKVVIAYIPTIFSLYAAKLIKILTGARTIAIVHDIESGLASSLGIAKNPFILRLMRLVERIGLNFVDEVVVLTEGMREELRLIGCKKPITVLPIWASVPPFVPVGEEKRNMPNIMYSGNFGKKQNLDQLFPLIKRLSDEKQPIKVTMRGDGSEKPRLEKKAQELQLDNLAFLPLVPSNELVGALQSANIHLVPQALNVANYALPSKLFSIMSAGRPFICIAEEGSPLDVLARKSQAGVCVRPNDEEALYMAVTALANDPDKQNEMGENGQKFVRDNMSKEMIMQEYKKLIERAA